MCSVQFAHHMDEQSRLYADHLDAPESSTPSRPSEPASASSWPRWWAQLPARSSVNQSHLFFCSPLLFKETSCSAEEHVSLHEFILEKSVLSVSVLLAQRLSIKFFLSYSIFGNGKH